MFSLSNVNNTDVVVTDGIFQSLVDELLWAAPSPAIWSMVMCFPAI